MNNVQRFLEIDEIPVYVRLGCSESEQGQPQKILVSVRLSCSSFSKAEESDHLDDAICYVKVAECVERICLEKPYHLIEHLGSRLFERLKSELNDVELLVTVYKVQPPHRLLSKGCRYTIGDIVR